MVAETEPGCEDAHADRAGALVARSGDDGRSGGRPVSPAAVSLNAGADFGRLEELRQPALGNARGFGHFPRPAAMRDVEQQRAGGLLHVHGELAGQAVADVVLGAQMCAILAKISGSCVSTHSSLVRVKLGSAGLAGELDEPLVADRVSCSQSHSGWVRVSHQMSDGRRTSPSSSSMTAPCIWPVRPTASIGSRRFAAPDSARNGLLRGAPPVFGILLGPAGVRAAERRVFGGG